MTPHPVDETIRRTVIEVLANWPLSTMRTDLDGNFGDTCRTERRDRDTADHHPDLALEEDADRETRDGLPSRPGSRSQRSRSKGLKSQRSIRRRTMKSISVPRIQVVIVFLSLPSAVLAGALGWAAYDVHHLLGRAAFRLSLEAAGDFSVVHRGVDVLAAAAILCGVSALASWLWCALGIRRQVD